MQQDKHRRLVAGVEPNRISDGEGKARNELLRNEVCGGLVNIGFKSLVVLPVVIRRRFGGTGLHTVFNGRLLCSPKTALARKFGCTGRNNQSRGRKSLPPNG